MQTYSLSLQLTSFFITHNHNETTREKRHEPTLS